MIGRARSARVDIPQIEVAADAHHMQLIFRHLQAIVASHDRDVLIDCVCRRT